MSDDVQITNLNYDAAKGEMTVVAIAPNVFALAAECTELLEVHEAKNYVEFDMIPRYESKVPGYRVTVQRMEGKSPAQRVIEMEAEVTTLRARIAELEAQVLTPDLVEALDTLLNSAEWELETAPADYHPETKEMVQSAIDTVRRIVDQLEAKRE